jgi:uncharacterized membrane protein YhaH (DUF805 family)
VGDFNPFKFDGRLGRLQYFGFMVIWWVLFFFAGVLIGVDTSPTAGQGAGSTFISFLLFGTYVIATVSYGVRRLHDFDKSGWWYLLAFIPLVNVVMALILLFAPGTPGRNTFGSRSSPSAATE